MEQDISISSATNIFSYLSICLNKKIKVPLFCNLFKTLIMKNNTTCIRVFADQVQINTCKEKLNKNLKSFDQLSSLLALAGNEVRLKIMFLLGEEEELCPCDLADILSMSIPAISQHLRKMKDGNVIEARRSGQTIFYSLKSEHMKLLRPFFKYIVNQNTKTELI